MFPLGVFPNETSIWETPLEIKEDCSDRPDRSISGPNPVAVFLCALRFFSYRIFSRQTMSVLKSHTPEHLPQSQRVIATAITGRVHLSSVFDEVAHSLSLQKAYGAFASWSHLHYPVWAPPAKKIQLPHFLTSNNVCPKIAHA